MQWSEKSEWFFDTDKKIFDYTASILINLCCFVFVNCENLRCCWINCDMSAIKRYANSVLHVYWVCVSSFDDKYWWVFVSVPVSSKTPSNDPVWSDDFSFFNNWIIKAKIQYFQLQCNIIRDHDHWAIASFLLPF